LIYADWLKALAAPDADDATVAAFLDWLEERGDSDQAERVRDLPPGVVRFAAYSVVHLPAAFRTAFQPLVDAVGEMARGIAQKALPGATRGGNTND
jgi:hypothetical protein